MDSFSCHACENQATLRCAGCISDPDSPDFNADDVYYCSKECQQGNWTRHKDDCNQKRDFKALCRAGSLAKELLLRIKEEMEPTLIHKINFIAERNELVQDIEPPSRECRGPFPIALCQKIPLKIKHAMAAALSDMEAIGIMHPFLSTILTGLYKEVKEITMKVHNVPFVVSFTVNDNYLYDYDGYMEGLHEHKVLKITLHSGQNMAFDISGAAFGLEAVVSPWEEFEQAYIRHTIKELPFGTYLATECEHHLCPHGNCCDPELVRQSIQPFVILNECAFDWLRAQELSARQIMRLSWTDYLEQKTRLVDHVMGKIHEHSEAKRCAQCPLAEWKRLPDGSLGPKWQTTCAFHAASNTEACGWAPAQSTSTPE